MARRLERHAGGERGLRRRQQLGAKADAVTAIAPAIIKTDMIGFDIEGLLPKS